MYYMHGEIDMHTHLQILLNQITSENIHQEVQVGPSCGKESWYFEAIYTCSRHREPPQGGVAIQESHRKTGLLRPPASRGSSQ